DVVVGVQARQAVDETLVGRRAADRPAPSAVHRIHRPVDTVPRRKRIRERQPGCGRVTEVVHLDVEPHRGSGYYAVGVGSLVDEESRAAEDEFVIRRLTRALVRARERRGIEVVGTALAPGVADDVRLRAAVVSERGGVRERLVWR